VTDLDKTQTSTVRQLALECGLAVASVTTAEPFQSLAGLLDDRVNAGHLAGMDWFTPERSVVSANPRALHANAQSIISVGIPYYRADISPPDDGVRRGRIARYAWGRDYHKTLKKRMQLLAARLGETFGKEIDARLLVDTARIVDRAVAARAGLGWYGKHTNLIVPGHGSFVMLGELLVDMELQPDSPINKNCGSCAICLQRCPTDAIVDPYVVHAPRCISFQTIEQRGIIPVKLRAKMGPWIFGCDVCQDVCPYTGAAKHMIDEAFAPATVDNAFPSLHWLLTMTEVEFRAVYSGTAVTRTKRKGLARNAAIALGNTGTGDDLGVLSTALLGHDEPLVRGHAAWAIGRLGDERGNDVLSDAVKHEVTPWIVEECRQAVERINYGPLDVEPKPVVSNFRSPDS
jgi:epoxyqueuosine reductase